jgi:hypothetical protein
MRLAGWGSVFILISILSTSCESSKTETGAISDSLLDSVVQRRSLEASPSDSTVAIKPKTEKVKPALPDSLTEKIVRETYSLKDSIKVLYHDDEYASVFINYNQQSDAYSRLGKGHNLDKLYEVFYTSDSGEFVIDNKLTATDQPTADALRKRIATEFSFLLDKWILVEQLDDEFLVRNSCDFLPAHHFTDSIFINGWGMDGPTIYSYESINWVSDNHLKIKLYQEVEPLELIKLNEQGAYILSIPRTSKQLSTPLKNARNFNIVEYRCSGLTVLELFDKPDFDKLIEVSRPAGN